MLRYGAHEHGVRIWRGTCWKGKQNYDVSPDKVNTWAGRWNSFYFSTAFQSIRLHLAFAQVLHVSVVSENPKQTIFNQHFSLLLSRNECTQIAI